MQINKPTALVLQGGGALGAYQYGILKALYEQRPNFVPKVVTGISIGAVNAAVLLGGKYGSIESLKKLWDSITMPVNPFIPQSWQAKASKMGNPSMYYLNPAYLLNPLVAGSIYDLSPFYELLESLIDFEKLNHPSTPRMIIEAVNVETGEMTAFSNDTQNGKGIDVQSIVSCISIPPNFPMSKVGENYYWDGGLFDNEPFVPALRYMRETTNKQDGIEMIVINLFRKTSPLPQTMLEITGRVQEIIFENKFDLHKEVQNVNEYVDLVAQIDKELPQDSPVRQNPAFLKLQTRAKIEPLQVFQYQLEGVEGTDDFTPEKIDLRFRTGYREGVAVFKNENK
jgi:NTE family protein